MSSTVRLDPAKLARLLPAETPPGVRATVAAVAPEHLDAGSIARAAAFELLGSDVKLSTLIAGDRELREALERVQANLEATYAALEDPGTPPASRSALLDDLELVLPARRAAITSSARSRAGTAAAAELDRALDVLARVVLAVARSFAA